MTELQSMLIINTILSSVGVDALIFIVVVLCIIGIVLGVNRSLARITVFAKCSYFLVPIEPVLNLTFRLILMCLI